MNKDALKIGPDLSQKLENLLTLKQKNQIDF